MGQATAEQKFAAQWKKFWKARKIDVLRVAGVTCVAAPIAAPFLLAVPFATVLLAVPGLLVAKLAIPLLISKIQGPHLGEAPGRARMGTPDDLRKAGMVRGK